MNRYKNNPILTREDIPEIYPQLVDVSSVFNPGAIKFNNKYLLLLRVQNRGRETYLLKAESSDGVKFNIDNKIITFEGIEKVEDNIYHVYDPRITFIDNKYYIMFAVDMDGCCKLGLGVTEDFKKYKFLGIVSGKDNRNGVIFPEKFSGKFYRLDRPNKTLLDNGVTTGSEIWLSSSEDLINWKEEAKVMEGRLHYWDEMIGAGPPPIKTKKGWLLVYHGVAGHFASSNIYQGGVALLDLKNPAKVLYRGRQNILEPREIYELTGQVPNVCFPSGMIVDEFDDEGFVKPESRVLIYYGAADTVVGLLETTVQELIDASKVSY